MKVAIVGIATYDQVVIAEGPIVPEGVVPARYPDRANGRCGGAPFYAGQALARAECDAIPIFTLGDDDAARAIILACHTAGLATSGVAQRESGRTARCLLIYALDGRDLCLFDPGDVGPPELTAWQERIISEAALVVIAASPASLVERVLGLVRPDQRLAWIFKDDPACFPDALCATLMARVDFLFHNRREGLRVDRWRGLGRPDAVLFETRGGEGVAVTIGGSTFRCEAKPIEVRDPTGAGDSFAGHALAELMAGRSAAEAARMAIARTAGFLDGR